MTTSPTNSKNSSASRSEDAAAPVQITILSRDRPEYFRQALASALAQDAGHVEVVVSDNSETDAVEAMMRAEFPHVRYRRRRPTLPALEHFRAVMQECTGELVVFFHDDDVLEKDYVGQMREIFRCHPDIAAASCNAWVMRSDQVSAKRFMGRNRDMVCLKNVEELLGPYMQFMRIAPAPFPAYMYRRRFLDGLALEPAHGGKYSDVSFLMKLVSRAPIVWSPGVHMRYRVHGGNDTGAVAIGQLLRLMRYVYTHSTIGHGSRMVEEYRFRYWLRWLRGRRHDAGVRPLPWREAVVRRHILASAVRFAFTRPGLWLRLLSKLR